MIKGPHSWRNRGSFEVTKPCGWFHKILKCNTSLKAYAQVQPEVSNRNESMIPEVTFDIFLI